MEIGIYHLLEGAGQAEGLTVIIDVFRAFSLECWLYAMGAVLKFKKAAGLDFYDKNGLDKFITYLRSDCGLEENSVQKQYKNLTWFLRWAIRKGYTQIRDVETYEPVFKTVKKPVIFLTKEELDKLYNLDIPASGTVLKLKTYEGEKGMGFRAGSRKKQPKPGSDKQEESGNNSG